jgi:hypothetical protein
MLIGLWAAERLACGANNGTRKVLYVTHHIRRALRRALAHPLG